jgi:hypothetical protein
MASIPLTDRFWSKVKKSEDGCWIWCAFRDKQGYGIFKVAGKTIGAHRVAYTLAYGPIPSGLYVCHYCDNPSCVRPDHLWIGTVDDNNNDKITKGRQARGMVPFSKHPERRARGERNGSAKLTVEQVQEIRIRYTGARGQQKTLACEYNVSRSLISAITTGRLWRDL